PCRRTRSGPRTSSTWPGPCATCTTTHSATCPPTWRRCRKYCNCYRKRRNGSGSGRRKNVRGASASSDCGPSRSGCGRTSGVRFRGWNATCKTGGNNCTPTPCCGVAILPSASIPKRRCGASARSSWPAKPEAVGGRSGRTDLTYLLHRPLEREVIKVAVGSDVEIDRAEGTPCEGNGPVEMAGQQNADELTDVVGEEIGALVGGRELVPRVNDPPGNRRTAGAVHQRVGVDKKRAPQVGHVGRAFGQGPTVIAPAGNHVHLFPGILAHVVYDEFSPSRNHRHCEGVTEAVGPNLRAGAAPADKGVVWRDDVRIVVHVQAQDFPVQAA